MDANTKIHLLSQELIPVINDLDKEPKQIVLDHMQNCESCQQLYTSVVDYDETIPQPDYNHEPELKPLKKLAQFNTGLKLLLVTIRAIILFYLFYSNLKFYDAGTSAPMILDSFQGMIFMFYLPASVFLLVFTITFFNKKWVWTSLAADVFIILFADNILKLLI